MQLHILLYTYYCNTIQIVPQIYIKYAIESLASGSQDIYIFIPALTSLKVFTYLLFKTQL